MDAKELGTFIAEIRKEKEMTQAELAEKLHVTKSAVSKWERGAGLPDVNTIEPLATALEVSIVEIVKSRKMTSEEILQADAAEAMKEIIAQAEKEKKMAVGSYIALGAICVVAAWLYWQNPEKIYNGFFDTMFLGGVAILLPVIALILKKYVHILSLGSFMCCLLAMVSEFHYTAHKAAIEDWSAIMDTAVGIEGLAKWLTTTVFILNVLAYFFSDKENQKALAQFFIDLKNAVCHAILWFMKKF